MTAGSYYKNYFTVAHRDLPSRDKVWKVVCSYLQRKFIPKDSVVLDLGAGYGAFINNVQAKERHALDQSDTIVRYAAEGVKTHVQSCTDLCGLGDGYFDVVFASNLLEHLDRDETEKTLAEVWRVLKPAGKLILLQPNFAYSFRQYFDDFTHKQIFTHVGLSDLLEASGFQVVANMAKFMPYSMRSRLPTFSWLVRLYLFLPLKPLAGQMLIVAQKQ